MLLLRAPQTSFPNFFIGNYYTHVFSLIYISYDIRIGLLLFTFFQITTEQAQCILIVYQKTTNILNQQQKTYGIVFGRFYSYHW